MLNIIVILEIENILNMDNNSDISKCPYMSGAQNQSAGGGASNRDWWPNQLKLNILRQNSSKSNPMHKDFDYSEAFKSLDLNALKNDLYKLTKHLKHLT